MAWEFDHDRPLYVQLVERIQNKIIAGEYKPGEKLPSVRDMAAESGVNPNTMQRALANLEQMGLLVTMRTNGRVVAENSDAIKQAGDVLATEEVERFYVRMNELGYDRKQALALAGARVDGGEANE